jgi:hypothetical protein
MVETTFIDKGKVIAAAIVRDKLVLAIDSQAFILILKKGDLSQLAKIKTNECVSIFAVNSLDAFVVCGG